MTLRDTNIIDYDKQVVDLENLQFYAAGKFWYDNQGHEISPDQMLAYAMKLEERNRKLEAENLWMRREIERVGHAIYTGDKGYVGTEEDLQAIGQSVEGICETLDRMIEPEAENEKLQEAQITRQLGRIRRGENLTTPSK